MVSLFKALMMIGFEHVAPRTLQRGEVTIIVHYKGYDVKWEIFTPFGSATYHSQKAALHGLVLRLAISKEELEYLASLGLEYAKEELENYEKTMKRIEAGGQRAIREYLKSLEGEKRDRNLKSIERQFLRQVIYPELEKILEENGYRCPICGRLMLEVSQFYSHLKTSPIRTLDHKEFLKRIQDNITNSTP
ncbi:hypothetical protein SJAV_20140 [Sulfurisphaera javensis]|uniref:C2H2-type domain-containing protein n=1 Tax=Sulfurisphaera javensis TaxID=2049879 RepID=A0AAT9GTP2_9CREN